ncbi:MAG: Lrp/AsnC family transcriptional regulator [Mycobacterium sp.]|nr:Lrp/AsnC family transcriptional regulator [Mycobacterium sp.]
MINDPNLDGAILQSPTLKVATTGSNFLDGSASSSLVTIDETDSALIAELLDDGKITNRELAQRINISESAVSIRLRKLTSNGILVFTAIFDWEVAGYEWFVIARIKARVRSAQNVAADVGQLPECEASAAVLGSHDVIAYFLVKDRAELNQLVDRLSTIDGVAEIDIDLAADTTIPSQGRQVFLAINPPPIRLPAPRIDLDSLDLAILQSLVVDGRQSSRSIARTFEVSEGTIRGRIARLTDSGLTRVVAMVEPVGLGMAGVIAAISVRVDRTRIDAIAKSFSAMPNVVFTSICLGNCDMHIAAIAPDPRAVMQFVGESVQSVDGVLSTDTLLMVDVVRFSPWMKRLNAAD